MEFAQKMSMNIVLTGHIIKRYIDNTPIRIVNRICLIDKYLLDS